VRVLSKGRIVPSKVVHEARSQLSRLVNLAERGEEIIVQRSSHRRSRVQGADAGARS
jgi:hypothetical protein